MAAPGAPLGALPPTDPNGPPNLQAWPPAPRTTGEQARLNIDRFEAYRRGRPRHYSAADRRNAWADPRHYTVPRHQDAYPGFDPAEYTLGRRRRVLTMAPVDPRRAAGQQEEFAREPEPGLPYHRVRRSTRNAAGSLARHRIRFRRLLGWGGNGVAALFERAQRASDGSRPRYVVKFPINPSADKREELQDERVWQRLYDGAAHFVQHIRIPGLPQAVQDGGDIMLESVPPPLIGGAPDDGWAWISQWTGGLAHPQVFTGERAPALLILEWCMRGEVHTAVCRMAELQPGQTGRGSGTRGLEHSNRALWHLFECLSSMVLGMAWPPKRNGNVPGWAAGNLYYERGGLGGEWDVEYSF
jgi:hypothetical protein